MAIDKAVDSSVLNAGLTSIANAIRTKGGTSAQLVFPSGFVAAIESLAPQSPLPEFTYTGNYQFLDDGNDNWRIKLLTSGTIRFSKLPAEPVDIFAVGGGGGGGGGDETTGYAGSGGGGGYTTTQRRVVIQRNTDYQIVIGAGGTGGQVMSDGTNGEATTAFGVTANGGIHGIYGTGHAGDGGSGGGGGISFNGYAASGGDDGANGGSTSQVTGGTGQSTTTREFGEADGQIYSGGGSGGAAFTTPAWWAHGGTGGGSCGNVSTMHGTVNLGGGGAGGCNRTTTTVNNGGNGGSGIAIIRNTR